MASEFLSQEEVDALLNGSSGEDAPPEEMTGGSKPEMRTYNLGTQERIVRGRMPTLEIINERFARLLRTGLFNFMRRTPEIAVINCKVIKYNEFVRNVVVPTNLNICSMRPLRGNGLFIFEPSLIFTIIDNIFGGDGRYHTRVEGRDFTSTEQRIIGRLLDVVFEEFVKSWAPVFPLHPEYIRSEMHTQFANIATPSEIVVVMGVRVEIGDGGGTIQMCIPYSTLEPIRDILYSTLQGDQAEPDRRWLNMLKLQVQEAEVQVKAHLAKSRLYISDIMKLHVGDVIPLDIPSQIEATVDNVPGFECSYGSSNGKYALKIEKVLLSPPSDLKSDHLEEVAKELAAKYKLNTKINEGAENKGNANPAAPADGTAAPPGSPPVSSLGPRPGAGPSTIINTTPGG